MNKSSISKQTAELPLFSAVHTLAFDFDGVFTDNKVHVDQSGVESVTCDRADGLALDLLRGVMRRGLLKCEIFILSTETNPVVAHRAQKLKISCHQGVKNKLNFLKDHFQSRGVVAGEDFAGLIYFGNDLNDLAVIEQPCFSVVPQDAHPLVKKQASLVIEKNGGDGFVRAFVELWLQANQIQPESFYNLFS